MVTHERSVSVRDVRAEYHHGDVMGMGEPCPRLPWISITDTPGWLQAAYEVEVDGNPAGRQEESASVFVEWPGPPLRSRERHRVRVRVWGADGSVSGWSDALLIEAGLLSPEDWTAQWITPVLRGPEGRPRCFRCPLTLRDEAGVRIERARLYATSAGINQLHLNGQVVGTSLLAPGWSAYADRLRYETHDVTDLLSTGANVLGAVVADGSWRGYLTWEMLRDVYGDRHGLLAQLEVTYSDGSTETFGTGANWVTSDGPIRTADLYNGEAFDARLVMDGWDSPGFDDSVGAPRRSSAPRSAGSCHPWRRPCGASWSGPSSTSSSPHRARPSWTSARTWWAGCDSPSRARPARRSRSATPR